MDFFERQEHARRQSRLLKLYFWLAVLAKIVLLTLIFGTLLQLIYQPRSNYGFNVLNTIFLLLANPSAFWTWYWHPQILAIVAALATLSILLGSVWQMRRLSRGGGKGVAELLGGRCVGPAPTDAEDLRLRRVVEEMAIAAGIRVPEIYVMDDEPGINAFTAGFSMEDTVIGVTRGCLKLLNRDELQGVVAHEFSHLLNGDTRVNMELIGLMHGLFWPAIVGRVMVHGECADLLTDDRSLTYLDLPEILLGYAMIALGFLGIPFVRVVKSALCRNREFFADAAAVQFTRFNGIAEALKKVGGLYCRGRLHTSYAETASHFCLVSCHMELFPTLLATHPPLEKRIRAIEPDFDGQFPRVNPLPPWKNEETPLAPAPEQAEGTPADLVKSAGKITPESLNFAGSLRAALSPDVQAAAASTEDAPSVIYALLLSTEEDVLATQTTQLRNDAGPELCAKALELAPVVQNMDDRFKLPLVDLAIPALRQMDDFSHERFLGCVKELVEADSAIDLFEYTLQKTLCRHLQLHRTITPRVRIEAMDEGQFAAHGSILVSALAQMDHDEPGKPEAVFERGIQAFIAEVFVRKPRSRGTQPLASPLSEWKLLPREECNLAQVDAALEKFSRSSSTVKQKIVLACALTAAEDDKIEVRKMGLLRAIADTLECPIPPFAAAMEQV